MSGHSRLRRHEGLQRPAELEAGSYEDVQRPGQVGTDPSLRANMREDGRTAAEVHRDLLVITVVQADMAQVQFSHCLAIPGWVAPELVPRTDRMGKALKP